MKLSSGDVAKQERVNRVYTRQRGKHIVKREGKGITETVVLSGMLRKLISEGDPTREDHWRKRDFWITDGGALCYFSIKNNKPMVLIDREDLHCVSFRVVDD